MNTEIRRPSTIYTYCRLTPGSTAEEQLSRIAEAGMVSDPDHIITEPVFASTPSIRRPAFMQLLGTLVPGDVLVVAGVDALGRDARDICQVLDKLESAKVAIYCAALGNVDLNAAHGRDLRTAFTVMADCESLLAVEQARKGEARPRKRRIPKQVRANRNPADTVTAASLAPASELEQLASPSSDENERAMSIPMKDAPRHAIEAVAMMVSDGGEKT